MQTVSTICRHNSQGRIGRHILWLTATMFGTGSCAGLTPNIDPGAAAETTVRVELQTGMVVDLSLERYVAGSVLAEADLRGLDDDSALRVAETQAIISRTYALANRNRHDHEGFSLCSTTHCQVYRSLSTYPPPVADLGIRATWNTAGQIMTYGGQPINAVYHADCGGRTSDASVPWGGVTPAYLRGGDDTLCQLDAPTGWQFETTRAELSRALNLDARTAVGHSLAGLAIAQRDEAGRALSILADGDAPVEIRGEVFRAVLVATFGIRSIKSTRFTINAPPNENGSGKPSDVFSFSGRGFGHGVGLCQRGAVARARRGDEPAEILSHYYPGATPTQYH